MAKRTYRAVPIQRVSTEALAEAVGASEAIVSIDLAKRKMVASFANESGHVGRIVRFEHPKQTMEFVGRIGELAKERTVEVVMEATGTYGDALRYQLAQIGVPLFRIGTKQVHDAAEVFDGVPSLHDAKACVLMTHLHAHGATRREPMRSAEQREMRALVNRREIYALPFEQNLGRIEAVLARHWPEGLETMDVWSWKSALVLLEQFPGAEPIAAHPEEAGEVLRRASRGKISADRIEEILAAAKSSVGSPMTLQEQQTLRVIAREALRLRVEIDRVDAEIEAMVEQSPSTESIAPVVGRVTATVLVAYLGPLENYANGAALEKACGLNLKIHSSGESKKGRLSISKRGPSIVRRYLYMAALRLLHQDPLLGAWYRARGGYRANRKLIAVVALMRKLVRALWHVAKGAPFDSDKLVDARRLDPNCN